MAKRIYLITVNGKPRLIEADFKGQAIRFCTQQMVMARSANAMDVADLMGKGIKIEKAKVVNDLEKN